MFLGASLYHTGSTELLSEVQHQLSLFYRGALSVLCCLTDVPPTSVRIMHYEEEEKRGLVRSYVLALA